MPLPDQKCTEVERGPTRAFGLRASAWAALAMLVACGHGGDGTSVDPRGRGARGSYTPAEGVAVPHALDGGPRPGVPEGGRPIDGGAADGSVPDPALPLRFAVIGDYGIDSFGEMRVADLVRSFAPAFIVTTGDNNYPSGEASTIDDNIGRYYSPFIGDYRGKYGLGSPFNRFWPSPGNHDWYTDALAPYRAYFTLPGNERYYDVTIGPVHLYALDSDFSEPDGITADSPQAAWLKGRLAASTSCFDVVYFHHPPYSSGPHGSNLAMQWPFEAWGAEVVMAGHEHLYERLQVGQIPYFTVGLGGKSIYSFVTELPESRARYASDFGALFAVADRRGLRFEFVDAGGKQVDSYAIEKECP